MCVVLRIVFYEEMAEIQARNHHHQPHHLYRLNNKTDAKLAKVAFLICMLIEFLKW